MYSIHVADDKCNSVKAASMMIGDIGYVLEGLPAPCLQMLIMRTYAGYFSLDDPRQTWGTLCDNVKVRLLPVGATVLLTIKEQA